MSHNEHNRDDDHDHDHDHDDKHDHDDGEDGEDNSGTMFRRTGSTDQKEKRPSLESTGLHLSSQSLSGLNQSSRSLSGKNLSSSEDDDEKEWKQHENNTADGASRKNKKKKKNFLGKHWAAVTGYMNSTRLMVLLVLCLQNSMYTILRRYSQGVMKETYSKVRCVA